MLTQDGRVAKALIGDDSDVEKEYLVRVRRTQPGPLPAEDLERLRHGLVLDGNLEAVRQSTLSAQASGASPITPSNTGLPPKVLTNCSVSPCACHSSRRRK